MRREDRDKAFWERIATRYDRAAKGVFGRPLPRVLALAAAGAAGAQTVLEVAAGTGLFTAAVAPRVQHVVATDYTDAMLAVLRRRVADDRLTNVEVASADLYTLPFPPATFDVVIAANVLHLVPDLPRALASLRRVLRPGGALIAPTYCHDETIRARVVSRLLATVVGQPMHRRFTAVSLRRALDAAGLRLVRSETVAGLIPVAYVEAVLGPG